MLLLIRPTNSYWNADCVFGAPSEPDPGRHIVHAHAGHFGQLSSRHRASAKNSKHRGPFVSILLLACSPTAVSRLIISVIVETIKRVSLGRLIPHVCIKIKEDRPSFADSYPPASVIAVRDVERVRAARFHKPPRKPCWSARQTVDAVNLACDFLVKASARLRHSPEKVLDVGGLFSPAVAETVKAPSAIKHGSFRVYQQAAKTLANDRCPSIHSIIIRREHAYYTIEAL